ncbi:MAG: superoxide dismutase [Elusimicrobia bacterium]|jgi:Fe-Mn family superoxide dismutase|nr:superoxide dismutase [Elusimicrobiota bacterium]
MNDTSSNPYATYKVRQDLKPKDLDGLSEKGIDQHWKLYEGYVTNTNLLNKLVWDTAEAGKELNNAEHSEIQRRFGFEYNGMVLHEYYFGALKKGSELAPTSPLMTKLSEDFKGFERWKKQFIQIGKFRGVGWVVLSYDPLLKRLNNFWISDHEVGNVAGFVPILVMDVWEHAYILDFGALAAAGVGRSAYIEAYFKNVNWSVIEERMTNALTLKSNR